MSIVAQVSNIALGSLVFLHLVMDAVFSMIKQTITHQLHVLTLYFCTANQYLPFLTVLLSNGDRQLEIYHKGSKVKFLYRIHVNIYQKQACYL